MTDPVQLGRGCWLDRAAILGLLRQNGTLLVVLKGGRILNLDDCYSDEEIEDLTRGPQTAKE